MHEESVGEEEVKYWTYPVILAKLWENGKINSSEFMLLGKLHTFKECFATNGWIARWWKRHPMQVSKTLSKLAKLGLIEMEVREGKVEKDPVNELFSKIKNG